MLRDYAKEAQKIGKTYDKVYTKKVKKESKKTLKAMKKWSKPKKL